jgi:hypothetical protein
MVPLIVFAAMVDVDPKPPRNIPTGSRFGPENQPNQSKN